MKRRKRRGLSTVETVVVIGAVILALVIAIASLGTNTNDALDETSNNVADPTTLPSRFSP